MAYVIDHHEFKRRRRVVADADCGAEVLPWNMGHQMQQVPVVSEPEVDQVCPFAILKPFRFDPRLLGIAWYCEIVLELCAHEALMIVRGGIDEMAEDLFAGPMAVDLRGGVGEARKLRSGGVEKVRELGDCGFEGVHTLFYC
jgi:hypothetical protein